jgi:hypothetical protein
VERCRADATLIAIRQSIAEYEQRTRRSSQGR